METNELLRLVEALGRPAGTTSANSFLAGPTSPVGVGLLGQLASISGQVNSGGSAATGTAPNLAGTLAAAGGGLTLLPIIGGLLKLFGGEGKKTLPELEPFRLPSAVRAEAALQSDGSTHLVDRGIGGRIRPVSNVQGAPVASPSAGPVGSTNAMQIHVQIQAMDSQSFLDRKEDIARAVREAMLHSHSLNDVVNEV
jgi:hypothetical protein